ncbi:MAG: ROK family protein [Lentisphaeria bacterium]|nr:ROK family protein [Lentisphaeria bacterium]
MLKQISEKAAPAVVPCLDPDFVPAVLWDRAFCDAVKASGRVRKVKIAMERGAESVSVYDTILFDNPTAEEAKANLFYVERLVKAMFWVKGGAKVTIAGDRTVAEEMAKIYALNGGARAFDAEVMGGIYNTPVEFVYADYENAPAPKEPSQPLGRHLKGCRIGFDLGGSDRKCAAVIDGEVVFSEEIPWDPYFQKDPSYHKDGINDTLKRCAAHLPRVDAIGGSSAGVYVANRVRIASLFRGVPKDQFESKVADIFLELGKEWGVPFEVVNDGEVTALAGSMELKSNSVLGVSLGTSMAGGYVNPDGNITDWLNELAFVPIDYRENGPADEWSGDIGCGVQYFSQQGVARLAPLAGIELPSDMPFPQRLIEVQKLMEQGDERAEKIFRSIGVAFGYTIARYYDFYPAIEKLLILGRVTSGKGGDIILQEAGDVIRKEFPEYKVEFAIPDEKNRRHGQAVAAASLPMI